MEYYYVRTFDRITKRNPKIIDKESRSVKLSERLETLGYELYRDNLGYKVKHKELANIEFIVRNFYFLEAMVEVLEAKVDDEVEELSKTLRDAKDGDDFIGHRN